MAPIASCSRGSPGVARAASAGGRVASSCGSSGPRPTRALGGRAAPRAGLTGAPTREARGTAARAHPASGGPFSSVAHLLPDPDAPLPPGSELDLAQRPRRNRRSPTIRGAFRETSITPDNLLLPIFVHDDEGDTPIGSMPGVSRRGARGVLEAVGEARAEGVNQFVLFPKTRPDLKTRDGREAHNPDGLVQRTLESIRERYPDAELYSDVALDPYNSDGHDGLVDDRGVVLNDETVERLVLQALSHARAGVDCVAPSDMMDGRIGAIREALDAEGFSHVSLMSYSAKYASAFYGPFREALDSSPPPADDGRDADPGAAGARRARRPVPPHKRTYQQDPANLREAVREALLDEQEGADALLVKPGLPYLDVIRAVRDNTHLPIACYQVSGEYAMLAGAIERGWLDERQAVLETLTCLRRAGADVIMTYYATKAARFLQEGGVGARW